jgi:hypothetical protein
MKFNVNLFMAILFFITGIVFLVIGNIYFDTFINCIMMAAICFLFALSYIDSNKIKKLQDRIKVLEKIYG